MTSMPTSILKTSICSMRPPFARSATNATATKRSVDFSPRTRLYFVPDISFYSQKEYNACFSTEVDEKRNNDDIVKTITVMRTGSAADRQCEDFCDRGLEHMSSSAVALQRKDNRARIIDSVLDEQDDQWDDGYYDGDRLATVSQHLTSDAVDLAIVRAQSDATIARRLNLSPTRMVEGDLCKSCHSKEEGGDCRTNQLTSDLAAATSFTSSTATTATSPTKTTPAPNAGISSSTSTTHDV